MGQRYLFKKQFTLIPFDRRTVKRRHKPYPFLTQPREIVRAKILKQGHPTKLK